MKSYIALYLFFMALWASAMGRAAIANAPPPTPAQIQAPLKSGTDRERIINTAAAEIGVTEATGNNDGPRVEAYLKSVGLERGQPYCAAFVYWCGQQALGSKNPFPRSGYSPDLCAQPTWSNGKGLPPRAGDTFGIYFPDKGRIAHTGLVAGTERDAGKWSAPRGYLRTIEANTSYSAASGSAADREGEGVHSKLRPLSTIRQVRAWLG